MFRRLRLLTLMLLVAAVLLPASALAAEGVVTAGTLVIRKEASMESTKLFTLYRNAKVDVLSESNGWYRVSYGKYTGYVRTQYIDVRGEIKPDGTLRPGDSGREVRELQELLKTHGYYTGSIDGDYGDDTEAAVRAFQRAARLTVDGRAGEKTLAALKALPMPQPKPESKPADSTLRPGDSGDAVKALQQSLKALGYFTGSIDGDYGSITENAVRAFQRDAKLTIDGLAGERTLAAIASGEIRREDDGTLRPGDTGSEVKALQELLKKHGYYSGPIDGEYGKATEHAVDAFQADAGLTRDGLAGAQTIEALKSRYTTESLDWFKNGSATIPKGAVFTVKDVETGRTFTVKRWAGVNHADCEPLTAEDTATMKSIYGGSWSWKRRAILVKYDGHVYAASMNGMPHGDNPISGNDFAGHFCIHFTGSKTHGTQRVDSDHQNAVRRALDATW